LLDTLGKALEAKDAAVVKATWDVMKAHACFALPFHETWRAPSTDDVEAMAAWWERGGRDWLYSGLASSGNADFVVLPPDAPKRVTKEKAPGLARLECAADAPPGCARESAGWALRANSAFAPRVDEPGDHSRERIEAECAVEAKQAKKLEQYRAWRTCLEGKRPQGAALPLGRFRAPTDGWLVLRGRRGHYHFCDEVRAYDLATGAAWVAKNCSGLVLLPGGSVDHDATDAKRGVTVQVGRLPVEALREAAWMTLLSEHVENHVQPYAWFVRRPAWLEPRWPDDGTMHGLGLGGFWATSAQTQLAWSWQGTDGLRDSGSLTWPNSSSAGEDHADELWRIAEAAFLEGCAPARLPAQLVVAGKPGVSSLDATPSSLRAAEQSLVEALYAADAGCR